MPLTVISPPAVTVELVVIELAVSMLVLPVISEVPLTVPFVITGAVRVLLVKVADAASVTITPLAGKVALELIPVPPMDEAKIPVTAALLAKLSAPNDGTPPPDGTVST